MAKRKLQRFAELETYANVFQHVQKSEDLPDFKLKGEWKAGYFKNTDPLVIELGCGKGEYTVGLAKMFSGKNFIGMDIKGARIWRGARTAIDEKISNAAFIRGRVDTIDKFFSTGEVDEIWITFPDPQVQEKRERKRMTSPRFLNRYRDILKKDGIIHLKTDNAQFFQYTLDVIKKNNLRLVTATGDLYGKQEEFDPEMQKILGIKTFYEEMFTKKGFKICYLQFQL